MKWIDPELQKHLTEGGCVTCLAVVGFYRLQNNTLQHRSVGRSIWVSSGLTYNDVIQTDWQIHNEWQSCSGIEALQYLSKGGIVRYNHCQYRIFNEDLQVYLSPDWIYTEGPDLMCLTKTGWEIQL